MPDKPHHDDLQNIIHTPAGSETQVFIPPSREALRVARLLPHFTCPKEGQPSAMGKLFGQIIIAPFTQLTAFNFDLQVFLYQVFHVRIWSKLSHGIFMPIVVFFVAAFLAQFKLFTFSLADHSITLTAAHVYGTLLCLWYLGLALYERIYLWWAISAPMTMAIVISATVYYQHFALPAGQATWYASTSLLYNPLLWMFVAAHIVAIGHAPENVLPPRAMHPYKWVNLSNTIFDENGKLKNLVNALYGIYVVLFQLVMGTLNEWWASPRLMPYCLLMIMFKLGYKQERYKEIKGYADKALASGNPALDYVGIGGGAYLKREYILAQ